MTYQLSDPHETTGTKHQAVLYTGIREVPVSILGRFTNIIYIYIIYKYQT